VPRFERLTADWLPLDEAVRRVLARATPLPAVALPLDQALGTVLAEAVTATVTLPPFDNSAMDGYAVRAADVGDADPDRPVHLVVVGTVHAGDAPTARVGAGEAVRIMTGAPLPPGADSVVRVEDTDAEDERAGTVSVRSGRDAGRHIRPGGQDFRAGAPVASAGTRVTPGWVAVLAAAGVAAPIVHRRPRVAILACGDELRRPDDLDDVRAGRAIPESNGPMLAAAVRAAGGEPVPLGIARDDEQDLRRRVRDARGCDLLITIGGASMGEADLLKRTLLDDGLELDFWRVRMRPGSPVSFGLLPGSSGEALPVLGLPGNPASAFVTFQLLGRPFVRRLAGDARPHRSVTTALAAATMTSPRDLCHLFRVTLEGPDDRAVAHLTGHQGSGLVSSLGVAQGLAVLPEGVERIEEGDAVQVIRLDEGGSGRAEAGYAARRPAG
jgi:molybdopterin molybdotransferase